MKVLNQEEKINELGLLGEKIMTNYFNSQGMLVEHAIDKFDREKDMTVNGKKVEIKTEQPYVMKDSLTIRETQLKKCKSVDELYFVTVPPSFRPTYEWSACIFKVDPENFKYFKYTPKDGRKMIAIPINQESVEFIKKLSDVERNELIKYRTSAY